MTLEEAIEIKTRRAEELHNTAAFTIEMIEADRLSLEALKRWRELRQLFKAWGFDLLPGETED